MTVWNMDMLTTVQTLRVSSMTRGLTKDEFDYNKCLVAQRLSRHAEEKLGVIINVFDVEFKEEEHPSTLQTRVTGRFGPKTKRVRLRGGTNYGRYYNLAHKDYIYNGIVVPVFKSNYLNMMVDDLQPWDSLLKNEYYRLAGWSEGNRCWIMETK